MARIEVRDITFQYEGHSGVRTALDNVSLTVEDGEFVCLVGRSGCGKTTGLQFPASGQILLDGKPVTGPGTDRAVVFQNYTLFPWMTARKNVEFGIRQANRTLSRAQIRERALDFLGKVSMAYAADQYPCCWTSPSALWTPGSGRSSSCCWSSCGRAGSGARPCSSSPTISRRPLCWRTG